MYGDHRIAEHIVTGTDQGGEYIKPSEDHVLVYHRSEPLDYFSIHDEEGTEVARYYINHGMKVKWAMPFETWDQIRF